MAQPARPGRAPGCPSDLRLDELLNGDLAGDGAASLRAHIDHCVRCRERAATFASVELSPWKDPPLPETAQRRRAWRWLAGLALPVAAAVVLVLGTARREDAGIAHQGRTKGDWALSLFVKRADGRVERLPDDGIVHPGDELRFAVTSARPGHVAVFSRDAKGTVLAYVPFGASVGSVSVAAGREVALPGSIETDATLGLERLTAVRCEQALSKEDLKRQLDDLVSHGHQWEGAGIMASHGCVETSVVFRKEPPGQ